MEKDRIQTHKSLGVEPHPIEFHPWGEPAKMEKGFTFEIPKDSQNKLKEIFLNSRKENRRTAKWNAEN